jgi:2-desacetyl-2-hydroxyethyl bacteriochlorophyllide A dehydrogenase
MWRIPRSDEMVNRLPREATMSATDAQSTMRQVIVSAEDGATVRQAPIPVPAAGEALVQMISTGVCGSDTHALHGLHPFIKLPYLPGHEVIGRVQAVAEGVTGIDVGQRVVVEPTLPCWQCKQCQAARENLCENLQVFGCVYSQGGMADWFTVPANRLHVVPEELDDAQAILIEPLSTPVHAVRLAGPVENRTIAILGGGTIGLLVLATVLHHGARRVVVTDMLESKRRRALALGAHAVVDAGRADVVEAVRAELGESADIVFDCVAIQPTIGQAIGMALNGGTVVVVGVPTGDVTVPLAMIQDHQVRIQGTAMYLPEDYQESMDILRAGDVRAKDFITGVYPMERVAEAYAASAGGEHIKVIVTAGNVEG